MNKAVNGGTKRSWSLIDESDEENLSLETVDKRLRMEHTGHLATKEVVVASLGWPHLHHCRCLGGPSIISQLKESIQFQLLYFIFLCETKKKRQFVKTLCRSLKF